jgi:hypothetical protein
MSRHTYDDLSPETEAALRPCVGQVAYEMGVSDKYLYAILGGEKTDPFEPFLWMFRAVARKNPEGALGYIARQRAIYDEEHPPKEVSNNYDVSRTFSDLMAVSAERDEGLCSQEKVEAAKARHAEAVARFGRPKPVEVERDIRHNRVG